MATTHKRGSAVTMIKLFSACLEKRFTVGTEMRLIMPQSLQGQRLQLFKTRSRNLSGVDSLLLEALVKPTQVMSLKQQNTSIVLRALIPPHISLIRKVKSVNVSVLWD